MKIIFFRNLIPLNAIEYMEHKVNKNVFVFNFVKNISIRFCMVK